MRQALGKVEGVTGVDVDFASRTVTCTVAQGVEDDQLTGALPERFTATVE